MITITQKRNYARAVLSSEFKKDSYIRHVNPHTTNPSAAAYRLERTKTMPVVFEEVRVELEKTEELEKYRYKALRGSLRAVEKLNAKMSTLSPQDTIRILSQTTRLLVAMDKLNRHTTGTVATVDGDSWRSEARNRHPVSDYLDGVIL